ncbi:DUF4286 family protein [Niabella sp. CC-SYL272]|uniref:DUF4286 family protein n=1 Tax=Niabella agricola TaxID=2891571 RepID=UPI001F235CB3|nr:DUF4286 family protein [Niabella agricola]MCF3110001.1 DUF4286 family protein [Niabella agricola]
MKPAYIWNITTKVTAAAHIRWLAWLKDEYIPAFLATGCFYDAMILKLMHQEDDGDPTYAVQFYARTGNDYRQFSEWHYAPLKAKMKTTWGTDCYSFESALQVVN